MPTERGFTLIEMVIVVAILGVLTVVAIPNLLDTMDRSKLGATMADMRTVASALERYAIENGRYPAAPDMAGLRPTLEPRYVKDLPLTDGWKHPLRYRVDTAGATYTLRSPGKDGVVQLQPPEPALGPFAADVVCVDGVFLDETVATDGAAGG